MSRERATFYLEKAIDNPGQAGAVADVVARLWGPGRPISLDGEDPDAVLTSLWPGQDHEPGGRVRAAAPEGGTGPPGMPPETGRPDLGDGGDAEAGHGVMTTEHTHPHSSYSDAGAQHSHLHVHRGDASHSPGAGHGHPNPEMGNSAVSADIRRRTAERVAAAAAMPRVEDMSDQQITEYMGRPPGR